MITADYRYIVIFEINANVPVYAPCCERLNSAFLGTFSVTKNAYSSRCGIEVGATGHIFTMLQLSVAETKKTRRANTSFSGDNVKLVKSWDASTQH